MGEIIHVCMLIIDQVVQDVFTTDALAFLSERLIVGTALAV